MYAMEVVQASRSDARSKRFAESIQNCGTVPATFHRNKGALETHSRASCASFHVGEGVFGTGRSQATVAEHAW
jgi:hypothetical protein